MAYQVAKLWPKCWAPASHLHTYARCVQVDRCLASFCIMTSIMRLPFFMSAPSKLSIHVVSFSHKGFARPGVPKLVFGLEDVGSLSVPFSDMHSLDSEILHQKTPLGFCFGLVLHGIACVLGDVDQSLFEKPTDHSWVSSASRNGSCLIIMFFY